jgi:cytidine deaminase
MSTSPAYSSVVSSRRPEALATALRPNTQTTLALLLLLVISLLTIAATTASAALDGKALRVVYGFDREFPPFTYEDPGGKPTGFEIELMQAVFSGSGASLYFRPLNWDRVPLELSAGTISFTTGMVRTAERARLYLFSNQPTFPLQIRLFTKMYNRYPSLDLFRGQRVAVEQGSFQHRLLQRFGGVNIKTYPNRVDGLKALYNDEVEAYCGLMQNTYYYINKLNYGAITTVGTPLGITEMRVAVNRDRGDVLAIINKGLAAVRASGEYDRLYRKWFVRELTEKEQNVMIAAATKGAVPSYAPYGKQGYGAALLTVTGKVYSACAVENADSGLFISAVRGALAKAIADGEFEIRAAVRVDARGKLQDLGREDLQSLYEFGPGILVIREPAQGQIATSMIAELLPNPIVKDAGLKVQ